MTSRTIRRVAVVVASAAVMILGGQAAASAAIECNPVNGAPSVASGHWLGSGSLKDVRAYYYHSCNSVSGVTQMEMSIQVHRYNSSGNYYDTYRDSAGNCIGCYRDMSGTVYATRAHNVTAADAISGAYRPDAMLLIYGSFSFGSVNGCARVNYQEVDCFWTGLSIYHTQ